MELVEVNHIRLQPFQRPVNRPGDRLGGDRRTVAGVHEALAGMLGGQNDVTALATCSNPVPDDLFRASRGFGADRVHRIHLCGIKKVDSVIQRHVDLCMGLVRLCLGTECHGAKAQFRDLDACPAKGFHLHGVCSFFCQVCRTHLKQSGPGFNPVGPGGSRSR